MDNRTSPAATAHLGRSAKFVDFRDDDSRGAIDPGNLHGVGTGFGGEDHRRVVAATLQRKGSHPLCGCVDAGAFAAAFPAFIDCECVATGAPKYLQLRSKKNSLHGERRLREGGADGADEQPPGTSL